MGEDLVHEISKNFKIDKIIELQIEGKDFSKIPQERIGYVGVYVLNFESGKRYIGHSVNVRNRMNQHKNIDDKMISITIFMVGSKIKAEMLEEMLIKKLHPEYNKIFNPEGRKKKKIDTGIWRIEVWKKYKRLKII